MPQPMPPSYMAYDRTIVVFSPDGRILQVEYARQMVKNGSTSIGLQAKDAVILGGVKPNLQLAVLDTYHKISEIDNHIAMISSGSLADSRNLVELARVKSQVNQITFGEPISVMTLTKALADRKHLVTQYAGVRPYGVGILIGGIDQGGPRLFETEPAGTMIEWKAQAIGRGGQKAKTLLNKSFKDGMPVEDAIKLLVKAMKAGEKDISPKNAEIVIVRKKKVERLTENQLAKYL